VVGSASKSGTLATRALCWRRCFLEFALRIGHSTYRGCPFLNLVTEFPDDKHPGRAVARGNKEESGQGSQPS